MKLRNVFEEPNLHPFSKNA